VFPAHEIMHMVWWALGGADPANAIAGWGKNMFPITSAQRDGARAAAPVVHDPGGAGAVRGRDGFNQMGPMITLGGLVIPNAETYEQLYPVRIRRHELRRDGGGAGRFRGGTGAVYDVEVETVAEYSFRGEGVLRSTGLGVEGGRDGSVGTLQMTFQDRPAFVPEAYALESLPPAHLSIRSPGGGGYGDPMEREVDAVVRDVLDELVSVEAAAEQYGVVMAANGREADVEATSRMRSQLRDGRHKPV
jgi:N-methylhydantoinase B